MLISLFRRFCLAFIMVIFLTFCSFCVVYYKNTSILSQLPIIDAYRRYVIMLIHGDFGVSLLNNSPVFVLIQHTLPITLELCLLAIIISHLFGFPFGLISGVYAYSKTDKLINFFILLGLATPTFWLALLLVTFFSFYLGWLPVNGRYDSTYSIPVVTGFMYIDLFFSPVSTRYPLFINMVKHTLLPVLSLALWSTAVLSSALRAKVITIMKENYITAASTRGLSKFTIIRRHVVHNALPSLMAYLGLQFPTLLTLSMVVDIIFNWNGFGYLLLYSLYHQDFAVISAGVLVIGTLTMIVYLFSDVISMILNPLRHKAHYAIQ